LTRAKCLVHPNGTHTSTSFELLVPKSAMAVGFGGIRNTTMSGSFVKDVFVHSEYGLDDVRNNLAMIELATPIPLSREVRPARITPEIVSSGDELIATGWGYKEDGEKSDTLQKVRLMVGSDSDCLANYPAWNGQNGEFVCTVSGRGRGVCDGDAGSPLVLPIFPDSNEDFAGYLVGISSFYINSDNSERCANGEHFANYFTRVAKHIDWIAKVMNVNSSELLATPKTEFDDDESTNSAISFLPKRFDDTLLSTTLCLFALAAIAFNH
jgi:secreted trypsin-like serine protease